MESKLALGSPPSLSSMLNGGAVALFLDFDGTLVDIAPRPDAIKPREEMAEQLAELSERCAGRCALVTGRALVDVEGHIGPLSIAAAGSHGSDIRAADGTLLGKGARGLPDQIERELREFADKNNVDYEAKPHGGALHYRSNPVAGEMVHSFAATLAKEHGWVAQGGKFVVEIVADDASKYGAVMAFMQTVPFLGSTPYFIGDDLTDEAGFEACAQLGGAGILVGERAGSVARYQLDNVTAVHEWLGL